MKQCALCLVVDGVEELELIAPVDVLRRAEVEVVLAAVGTTRRVTGRCGVALEADALLGDVAGQEFDLLLVPGGPGVKALRADGRAAALARQFAQAGKPVAAICAAPLVLADAGLLAGRRFTAHYSVHAELPGVLAAERVVQDGKLITSRGAGTALEFGLTLVRELRGEAVARDVAAAIML